MKEYIGQVPRSYLKVKRSPNTLYALTECWSKLVEVGQSGIKD